MRRLPMIVALGALVGMVAGLMTAGPALAGRGPKWEIAPVEPFTLPADYCGFPVGFSWPVRNEYSKILKAADGSMIVLITGVDKIVATNLSTGKAVTAKHLRSAKPCFRDGSVTVTSTGLSGFVREPMRSDSGCPR